MSLINNKTFTFYTLRCWSLVKSLGNARLIEKLDRRDHFITCCEWIYRWELWKEGLETNNRTIYKSFLEQESKEKGRKVSS